MAFGQTNTGFQMGIKTPFTTGFSTEVSNSNWNTNQNPSNKNTLVTYNSRYPGFDEEDYKRLEQIADAQGVTGSKKAQLMDELYQYYYPQVLNKHKLDERQEVINNNVYENGEALLNGDTNANMNTKLLQLSQQAKEKFGIAYDVDDNEVIKAMTTNIPDGDKLLAEYINSGNPELLYQAGIYERPQQGGVKSLINPASEGGILPESNWEWLNPVGATTETIDNAANKFAELITVRGDNSVENLKNEINNMSQEEVDKYRQIYNNAIKNEDRRVAYVEGDNNLERIWNAIRGKTYYRDDDEAFMKWLISQKANLGQSLIGADDILKGESNPNVIQFFGNIPSSAIKTFTATVRGMTNPFDTFKGLYKLAATEEGHQAILQRYGSWEALAKAMNTDPVGVADDILAVAELGANIIGGGMKATGKLTGNQNLISKGGSIQGAIGSANDVLAQKTVGSLYGGMDKLAGLTNNKLVQGANTYLQDVSSLGKMVEEGKEVLDYVKESKVGQSVKNYVNELIDKTVGLDEADREFIQNNKDLVNEYVDGKKNVETVYDTVKEKLSDKALEKTEVGTKYDDLTKSKKKSVKTKGLTNDNGFKKTFKKNGITIDSDGNLQFQKPSEFDLKQQKAIQDAWDVIKEMDDAGKIDNKTALGQRKKLDNKINWEGKPEKMTSSDIDTEKLIKEIRNTYDSNIKKQIPGLKELDAEYQPLIDEVKQMKKDWFNPDGTIKDNARSKIRNLTKAGNEEKLARLEQIAPGITQDLRALDVGLTIEKATKQGVGQYVKGGAIGGSMLTALFTGHPVAALGMGVVGILTTPKNFVRLVETYPDIVQKLQAGQELLPSDLDKLTSLASRLQDGME